MSVTGTGTTKVLNAGVIPTDTQSWTSLAGIDPGPAEGYSLIYMLQNMHAESAGFVNIGLDLHVEVGFVRNLQGWEQSGDRACVRTDLEGHLALDDHGVLVPAVLHEAVGREEPGERSTDHGTTGGNGRPA